VSTRPDPVARPDGASGSFAVDFRGDFVLFDVQPSSGVLLPPTRLGRGAVLRSHTVIYAGSVIGERFQTGHGALVREACTIGDDVSVGSHAIVEHHVAIGHGVRIHGGAFVPEFSVLEEGAWLGPKVVLTNARYPQGRDVKKRLRGPHVGQRAKIGAGAVLLPAVRVGAHALVGAGAVVTRDVPDHQVVVGNPARVVNDVRELGAYLEEPKS
jgi:acetyltransferase-like isoleucine patch superfamily enzyme